MPFNEHFARFVENSLRRGMPEGGAIVSRHIKLFRTANSLVGFQLNQSGSRA